MGIAQSIFAGLSGKEEDEQQLRQLYSFLDDNNNYKKPYNGASFHNPPYSQISSSSSYSSSRPNTIDAPGADINLQLPQLYSFLDDNNNYKKPYNGASLHNPPYSQISSSSSYSSSRPNTICATGADLNLQLQLQCDQYHYSSSEDEVQPTTTRLQKPSVSSAMEAESNGNEDEGLHYNKQMDVIINVPSFDYQSLASTNTFNVVNSTFFSIEKEEKEVEEVEDEKQKNKKIKKRNNKKKVEEGKQKNKKINNKNKVEEEKQNNKKIKNKKKVEEEKVINCCVRVEGIWITHYSRSHKILLVGEGDFSFSTSLALVFGSASNMIATSLDSQEFLKKNYGNAMVNIKNLRSRGCKVVHGIDATQIASSLWPGKKKFDRIVYNFPFAGFFKDLSRNETLRKHRRLVSLFMKNAKQMIGENGEIHITHKTNGFHKEWNLENIASSHGLRLIEATKFNRLDYPGYNTKRGFGGDDNFDCDPAKTYKFGLKNN